MIHTNSKKTYIDLPCERCGSKKRISKTWIEEIKTSFGTSSIEASQIVCSNAVCQSVFDERRAEEVVRINERKLKKEEQDKIRKDNIARTINERRLKAGLSLKK